MIVRFKALFPSFLTGVLNSYSQVFFSNNRLFAIILIAVSFIDLNAGVSGLIAVMVSNILAYLIGFNTRSIRAGNYGFNSLLTGLGIGIFYQPGTEYFALLIFVSLLTLFLTSAMDGFFRKYALPFMSVPFLISIWVVTLASRHFTHLEVSERGLYMMNEMYSLGKLQMVEAYNWFNNIGIPPSLVLYFRSLGAIFFQYTLFAGIIVAAGLVVYSRIAFLLSLTGFFAAWFYYQFIGADLMELSAGYIGFNFILTAIAIGGFFIVPSKWSFLWVLLLTPLVSIILTSSNTLLSLFQLSVFSLPFNIIVLLFLYILKFRERFNDKPQMVLYQQYSPEKNLYATLNYRERFGTLRYMPLDLPFIGTWKVTQAESGEITHTGDWKHAWDFEVPDDEGHTFSGDPSARESYYSFGKPVLAPADGIVEETETEIEDNEPGKVNLDRNWGNSVVIRHDSLLYTKVSHLKKGSIRVTKGQSVKKGEVIGACGNSGRSPLPHIHFQVQATPFIGSKTLDYPLGHYLVKDDGAFSLHSFEKPQNGQMVCNIGVEEVLDKAFHFIPGQKFIVTDLSDPGKRPLEWEVEVNHLNNTCICCAATGSKAWFIFDGNILWFTQFEGDKRSLLFYFYLAANKTVTGFYRGLELRDSYPIGLMRTRFILFFQDFLAPFIIFIRPVFSMRYTMIREDFIFPEVMLESSTRVKILNRVIKAMDFKFQITKRGIERFTISEKGGIRDVSILPAS
jgi:urea transporter/murein DD-endopeptidase MepM/ murein hydrolase activator NlpD